MAAGERMAEERGRQPLRERGGLVVEAPDAAAAAVRTTSIELGTAIVPTYPRHPLALAQQALTVADLAPGRLRLGVGPSHRHTMEGVYGLPMGEPLAQLREY